jgi:hypothetical protein
MPKIKVSTDEVEHAAKQVQQAGATTREAADHLAGGRMSDPGRLSATSTVYEVTERNLSEEY